MYTISIASSYFQTEVNLINRNLYRAALAKKGITQQKLSEITGIPLSTLCRRIKHNTLGTDDVKKIMTALDISNPMPIFFND
jgi:predicted transcriptional regulator